MFGWLSEEAVGWLVGWLVGGDCKFTIVYWTVSTVRSVKREKPTPRYEESTMKRMQEWLERKVRRSRMYWEGVRRGE